MLVVTRTPDEGITLQMHGETIHLTLVNVQGHQARLGIEAPAACVILRDELLLTEAANRAAAAASVLPTHPSERSYTQEEEPS